MATINGVEFNLSACNFTTRNRNIHRPSNGSIINTISNTGMDGATVEITGYETSQSDYDDVIEEFFGEGVQELIISTGWVYRVYSTTLKPTVSRGIGAGKHIRYRLSCVCQTSYQYSTTENEITKSITSDAESWDTDNNGTDTITTAGNVNAPVDIKITAPNTMAGTTTIISQTEGS